MAGGTGAPRIAYAILHDEGQAEDAVIAAFEKILRNEKGGLDHEIPCV